MDVYNVSLLNCERYRWRGVCENSARVIIIAINARFAQKIAAFRSYAVYLYGCRVKDDTSNISAVVKIIGPVKNNCRINKIKYI